ncbi:UPF0728 protein-like [Lineus longissimus]|uniref:UPF0728 protein-like n=1 Tax=Lineus longissimus TaxID=88925 RepID=UPI002B4F3624
MPANAIVYVHYGPYESCGVVDHRESRLEGLMTVLKADGHNPELVKMNDWNVVELWVNGERIFSCDIRELDYGGDGKLDDICSKALEAVVEAY